MNDFDEQIDRLGPWFHNLHLPDGTQTAPDHPLGDFPARKWRVLAPFLPASLDGWNVLDIGCNAGFYSLALAARGARVTGVDCDPHYLAQADWATNVFGLRDRIELRQQQIYELGRRSERYDLVLFMGVFYHLRYPLLALDIVSRLITRMLVFQTLTMPGQGERADTHDRALLDRAALLEDDWPKMAFIEHRFAGDPTNWWVANHAGVMAMLRSAGLRVTARPGHEIYLCEADRRAAEASVVPVEPELAAAIGAPVAK